MFLIVKKQTSFVSCTLNALIQKIPATTRVFVMYNYIQRYSTGTVQCRVGTMYNVISFTGHTHTKHSDNRHAAAVCAPAQSDISIEYIKYVNNHCSKSSGRKCSGMKKHGSF